MRRALLCALVLVLAGCAAPNAPADPSEPGTDRLGWENGYWVDDDVTVDADDGLNESEQETVVSRQMARLEQLRQLEFEEDVDVRVITRTEYLESRGGGSGETHARWNDQVWEALFLVGEDTSVDATFNDTLGSSVSGYYRAGTNELVIVSDNDEPTINRRTLVHELVHALQDQQFGLGETPDTQDRQLARNGLVEGEARLLENRYEQRCTQDWDCVEMPPPGNTGGGDVNRGVLLVILAPYQVGPDFVAHVQDENGWEAINDLHGTFPASMEQIIYPERFPEETPENVTVPDRSGDDWERFDHDPVADTVGQASIHAMFVDNGIQSSGVGRYTFRHPAAAGWAGDAVVPYRNGDRYGYVWETAWENKNEAREFADAYRELLESHDATVSADGVAVVPESSPFEDAFRVTREGQRVRIVNGPSVQSLSAIHAG